MLYICLLAVSLSPFAQTVQDAYAQENADQLRSLMEQANSRVDSLLVRYRLYPLTENAAVLEDLPETLPEGTAQELALLSGLWAYRAGEVSIFNAVSYGRRSSNLLEAAKQQDPDAPYVLLVEGQSLLFRPSIAGKDAEAAAQRFDRLADLVQDAPRLGIAPMEARSWRWLALREAGESETAAALHDTLLAENPAPLYRKFLQTPPDV